MFLAFILSLSMAMAWSPLEKQLYRERRFLELEQSLILKGKLSFSSKIRAQRTDLYGCKDLKEGVGKDGSFLRCKNFMDREEELGLLSESGKSFLKDLNIICRKFSEKPSFVQKVLNQNTKFAVQNWGPCREALWRQIYLTSTANFSADPVGVMALVRKAEVSWGPDKRWDSKIKALLYKK